GARAAMRLLAVVAHGIPRDNVGPRAKRAFPAEPGQPRPEALGEDREDLIGVLLVPVEGVEEAVDFRAIGAQRDLGCAGQIAFVQAAPDALLDLLATGGGHRRRRVSPNSHAPSRSGAGRSAQRSLA